MLESTVYNDHYVVQVQDIDFHPNQMLGIFSVNLPSLI